MLAPFPLTFPKLALVCGLVGTDFGLNKDTNYLSNILGEPLKPAYSANLLLAVGAPVTKTNS